MDKHPDANGKVTWHIAMGPDKCEKLDKTNPVDALIDQHERLKAGIRAKVEHSFRVLKRQWGYVKVCYRGSKKNATQIVMLFALSNLWMARRKPMPTRGAKA